MLARVFPLCVLIACGGTTTPSSDAATNGDAASTTDAVLTTDGPMSDAASGCVGIANEIASYITSHRQCSVAQDCGYFGTACGLPSSCGAIMAASAHTGLDTLVQNYYANNCSTPGCVCPQVYPQIGCNNGTCDYAH